MTRLRVGVKVGPQQGLAYDRLAELAAAAESAGFEAFFRSDHWLPTTGPVDQDASDAWVTIAALARDTSSIRLGSLVSPVGFRSPYALAKATATIDQFSAGRIEVGLGGGWHAPEHGPLGLPFGSLGERFERLEEQLLVVPALWSGQPVSHAGRHYQLEGAICRPTPVQRPRPPLIVGGKGRPRGLRLAARHADEYNVDSLSPEACRAIVLAIDALCLEEGRDPSSIGRSVMARTGRSRADVLAQLDDYAAVGIGRVVFDLGPDPRTADVVELGRWLGPGGADPARA